MSLCQLLLHERNKSLVRSVRALTGAVFDEFPFVGFHPEEVYERVVGLLVGQEYGVEAGFAERSYDTPLAVDAVVVGGVGG